MSHRHQHQELPSRMWCVKTKICVRSKMDGRSYCLLLSQSKMAPNQSMHSRETTEQATSNPLPVTDHQQGTPVPQTARQRIHIVSPAVMKVLAFVCVPGHVLRVFLVFNAREVMYEAYACLHARLAACRQGTTASQCTIEFSSNTSNHCAETY